MDAVFTLEQGQELTFIVHFELAFLQFEEFPPDANRGFDVPGIILQGLEEGSPRIYTETLMVEMPYPDFSMPYNVITLTSTLVAFMLTMLNLFSRPNRQVASKKQRTS